jgi:hypothetical protein
MWHARLITMMLVLAGLTIHASAQLSEQLSALANQWEFLAQLGQRCDARLTVHGYAAVQQGVCETFVNEYDRLHRELQKVAEGVESSSYLGPDMNRLITSFEAATKVTQHILFLGQAEINTLKQRKGGKRAPP